MNGFLLRVERQHHLLDLSVAFFTHIKEVSFSVTGLLASGYCFNMFLNKVVIDVNALLLVIKVTIVVCY